VHKKNIQHIIDHGTPEQMEEMKEVLEDAVCELKTIDYHTYLTIEYRLHCIAHHGHLGEEAAKCWVSKMKNKDGTQGAHWTWEQTEQVRKDKAQHIDASDWYAVLNMMYSDYYNSKFDAATYIDMAKDWIMDSDVGAKKTLQYYYFVVKA
jgi:hypothetical protein